MDKLKLYHYDHCPYCIRVRIILGLKKIPFESIILQNSDENSHFKLVNKKVVPILEYEKDKFMIESLDIVKFLDEFDNKSILEKPQNEFIQNWINENSSVIYRLAIPRFVKLNLEEFKDQKDIDYFTKKKENFLGNFEELLENTSKFIEEIEKELETLNKEKDFLSKENFSYDDIFLFPTLRNLTCVKGLTFPENVLNYLNKMSELTNIDLYFDRIV